jgi:hypothetical protein
MRIIEIDRHAEAATRRIDIDQGPPPGKRKNPQRDAAPCGIM